MKNTEDEVGYDSDKNKLGWIVGAIGFVYLPIFLYFTFSGNVQAQILSGASMLVIFVIDMLIFKLTEFKTEGIN